MLNWQPAPTPPRAVPPLATPMPMPVGVHDDDLAPAMPPPLLPPTDAVSAPPAPLPSVTNDEFLAALFGPHTPDAHARPLVCSLPGDPAPDGKRTSWPAKAWTPGAVADASLNQYAAPATFRQLDGQWKAQSAAAMQVHAVMLDDVGTKVPVDRLDACPPTWMLETSPGNFQAGYLFTDPIEPREAEALKKALIASGLCDPGASGGAARWMRLPCGINGKPKHARDGAPWRCRLTDWHPARRYTPEQLVDLLELEPAPAKGRAKRTAAAARPPDAGDPLADDVHVPRPRQNAVVQALKARGLYKRDLGDGRHEVTCFAVHEHTDGVDHGTVYFEPSELFPVGGFKCLHSHGDRLRIGALLQFLGLTSQEARHRPTIRLHAGALDEIATAAERELAASGRYYQRGGLVVSVVTTPETGERRIQPETLPGLTRALSGVANWTRFDARAQRHVACDPPARHVAAVHDATSYAHLAPLAGLAHQPHLRQDGSVCAQAGYDEASCLFGTFDARDFDVPAEPTRADAEHALATLRELLGEFAFGGATDEAAALAAMLTAAIRPSLPTAPMFHVRAPQPGSGKSYLTSILAGFASPAPPRVAAWPTTEEEAAKLLLALLMTGPPAITFDNLTSDLTPLRGLCSALTEPHLEGRVLGVSKTASVSTRTVFLASGNNVAPVADMARRCVVVTLDPRIENPAGRRYSGDPLAALRAERGRFVSAALTLIRAFIVSGQRVDCQPLASFGDWSRLVREPLLWLGLPDPVAALFEQIAHDPDRETLGRVLQAWSTAFGDRPTMIREAIARATAEDFDEAGSLQQALAEIGDGRPGTDLNSRSIGRWVARHAGRVVGGLRFERARGNSSGERWACRPVATPDRTEAITPETDECLT